LDEDHVFNVPSEKEEKEKVIRRKPNTQDLNDAIECKQEIALADE
jgi:hypothetical protein